jgi:RHS repeat-associated protein
MQYVYALGTRPLAQYGGAWEYLLPDALGSVRQIVDANGNVTLAESYEPYGSVLSSNGTASSIFAYAGEQIDTSGLVFLRARYMNPTLGIFLARDPWSGINCDRSMNGWNYGDDNPVNRIDPSGRFSAMMSLRHSAMRVNQWRSTNVDSTCTLEWKLTPFMGMDETLLDAEDGDAVVYRAEFS